MERVCPACNKLALENVNCLGCGSSMTDAGRAQEILQDDYTANMSINDAPNYCVHIFICRSCGNSEKIQVNKIVV